MFFTFLYQEGIFPVYPPEPDDGKLRNDDETSGGKLLTYIEM